MAQAPPLILFGAFDRHNFGDMLFAHVAGHWAGANWAPVCAGLAARDLRRHGGHGVEALRDVLRTAGAAAPILHVGGELLTCGAWEAAVMLLPPAQAQKEAARFAAAPDQSMAWARSMLAAGGHAPYLFAASKQPWRKILFTGVGGAAFQAMDGAMRSEVLDKLRGAVHLSVRERRTQAQLAAAGVRAMLVPDPAVMVAAYFDQVIARHRLHAELAALRQAFPAGYIAFQCSTEFGAEPALKAIAAQLDRLAASTGWGIICFRAGAAPWHDRLDVYARLAARLSRNAVRIFTGLNVWEICALIAGSRAYCGSSLHGRIVAMAYALPRINILAPRQLPELSKQAAYAAAWEIEGMPGAVGVADLARAMLEALATDQPKLREHAANLVAQYRLEIEVLQATLAG
jgi:hypothetical protein